jgi:hypothetical protein
MHDLRSRPCRSVSAEAVSPPPERAAPRACDIGVELREDLGVLTTAERVRCGSITMRNRTNPGFLGAMSDAYHMAVQSGLRS